MKVAITGTIGSGKTEVSNYLRTKGYDVFDCDRVNSQLLESRGFELLKNDFCDCFINNKLDKTKLASIIFSNDDKKRKLESIMHPLILKELLKKNDDPLFAEVPLLFESNWDIYFDTNILIVSDEDIAIKRLINRGVDMQDAKKRIASQMSIQEKIKKASIIIYNNGSLEELYAKIDKFLDDIC